MKLLLIFIILSIVNVIMSTIRSIATIKGGKTVASIVSGLYFAFYNIMLIYTVADFPMWEKCVITFFCNVTGVWIVKYIEEKLRKDKVWKVEVTVPNVECEKLLQQCKEENVRHYNYIDINQYKIFNFYCNSQKESSEVKKLLRNYNIKYFVTESKTL